MYDHHHMHLHSLLKAKSQLYQMTTMAAAGSLMAEGLGVRHTQKNDPPVMAVPLTLWTPPSPMVMAVPLTLWTPPSPMVMAVPLTLWTPPSLMVMAVPLTLWTPPSPMVMAVPLTTWSAIFNNDDTSNITSTNVRMYDSCRSQVQYI